MSEMLWGGRFEGSVHPEMLDLTTSIGIDVELLEQDLASTRAHARVLVTAGLLEESALSEIDTACKELLDDWRAGRLVPSPSDEDVHSLVERVLTEKIGETGSRIHAGRSRNDLVAADLRLWCKGASQRLTGSVADLVDSLVDVAESHVETIMPGYTHVQRGQPVSLAFHLLAHGFSFVRDAHRFQSSMHSADVSVLGAGALAGNTLGLDARVAARELGFAGLFDNAMDAVSDRDFVAELVFACALCGVHLSRLAEEIVLWTSAEFGFARLADEWSTGSSMMPQKRNPDLAELIRGRAAGGIGDLTGLLSLLKGLPLAYDRDLQEDKTFLFASVDRTARGIVGADRMIKSLSFDRERMAEAARESAAWATDLAELLVSRGVPFRMAHEAAGRVVASLEKSKRSLSDLDVEELQAFHTSFAEGDTAVADPNVGLAGRTTHGGTAPESVEAQIESLRSFSAGLRNST